MLNRYPHARAAVPRRRRPWWRYWTLWAVIVAGAVGLLETCATR